MNLSDLPNLCDQCNNTSTHKNELKRHITDKHEGSIKRVNLVEGVCRRSFCCFRGRWPWPLATVPGRGGRARQAAAGSAQNVADGPESSPGPLVLSGLLSSLRTRGSRCWRPRLPGTATRGRRPCRRWTTWQMSLTWKWEVVVLPTHLHGRPGVGQAGHHPVWLLGTGGGIGAGQGHGQHRVAGALQPHQHQ